MLFGRKNPILGVDVYDHVLYGPNFTVGKGHDQLVVTVAQVLPGQERRVVFNIRLPRGTNVAAILASVDVSHDPNGLSIGATPGEDGRSIAIAMGGPTVEASFDSIVGTIKERFDPQVDPANSELAAAYYQASLAVDIIYPLRGLALEIVDV